MDPTGMLADTAYEECDPWPVLYLEPGLWECAGSAPGSWRRVDLRGRVPTCSCRRQDWRGRRCWHIMEVQRQAPAIEASRIIEAREPERAEVAWNNGAVAKSPAQVQALGKAAYADLWGD